MSIDYDKFREKIPKTPALIPFVYIGDVNIEEELKKIFGSEKIFTDEQIQKIKSCSIALRDFLTNMETILLFAKLNQIGLDNAIKKQHQEEKETLGRTIFKFLLQKDISELTPDEITRAIEFGLAIKDKEGQLHIHPIVLEIKKAI